MKNYRDAPASNTVDFHGVLANQTQRTTGARHVLVCIAHQRDAPASGIVVVTSFYTTSITRVPEM